MHAYIVNKSILKPEDGEQLRKTFNTHPRPSYTIHVNKEMNMCVHAILQDINVFPDDVYTLHFQAFYTYFILSLIVIIKGSDVIM